MGGAEITADTINETPGILLMKLFFSKFSDYRLYGGIRTTLVFNPGLGLPKSEELHKLCEELQPMMNTQLWRKWHPIYIPMSSKQIDVIGFENHALFDDEEFDIAFPPLKKSEFHHRSQTFENFITQTFSPWVPSPGPSSTNGYVPVHPVLRHAGQNTAQISYAAVLRK